MSSAAPATTTSVSATAAAAAAPKPPPPTASSSSSSSSDRISAHTHITGLGLNEYGEVEEDSENDSARRCGFVGQEEAREACGLVCDLICSSKFAGRALLLVGPPSTGKTALANAICKEISRRGVGGSSGAGSGGGGSSSSVPFTPFVASQVYSKEVKKTEILMEHFRKSIGLRIRENKEVYEGEVTELSVHETEDPLSSGAGGGGGGYGRTISHVILSLKTTKGSKTLKLDPTMYDSLSGESVTVGDVIYIEANSGAVKRLGRSDTFAAEFDLDAEEYVPIPKGDVHKKRQVVQDVTLHDLDVANARPMAGGGGSSGGSGGGKDIMSLMSAMNGGRPLRKTEITEKLRNEINKVVTRYVDEGIAELVPGVLFIDEVHMLDQECFTFLNRSIESSISPIVILATNRGVTKVHGSEGNVKSPHGVPIDFLDRLLIVPTHPYTVDEMSRIIAIRTRTERIQISPDAVRMLGRIGAETSLRYVMQMLLPAHIICQTSGKTVIDTADVEAVNQLFLHGKQSARILHETNNEGYMV